MTLQVERVTWHADGRAIVDGVSLMVAPGEMVGLIGPNGSGKSTLLRTVYRVLRPDSGRITLDGDDVWLLDARQAARRSAAVMQDRAAEFDFSVYEIVLMGRNPHKELFDRDTSTDFAIVDDALRQVGMLGLSKRSFYTLSGGEKQRVLIARALAQQAQFLILDEPTNHLDIRYQIEILELVRELGVTTLTALHDLNLAALYCDRLYVLQAGRIVAAGAPCDVLTSTLIRAVYGVEAEVADHPATGRPHITFFPGSVRVEA